MLRRGGGIDRGWILMGRHEAEIMELKACGLLLLSQVWLRKLACVLESMSGDNRGERNEAQKYPRGGGPGCCTT
jgi:hypothetical protein